MLQNDIQKALKTTKILKDVFPNLPKALENMKNTTKKPNQLDYEEIYKKILRIDQKGLLGLREVSLLPMLLSDKDLFSFYLETNG